MNTLEIENSMQGVPCFIGVFPADKIPPAKGCMKTIVNLDPANKSGSHWIAIFRSSNGYAYYFDPYGDPPFGDIKKWLKKNSVLFDYNKTVVQKDFTSCGQCCMNFLLFHVSKFIKNL